MKNAALVCSILFWASCSGTNSPTKVEFDAILKKASTGDSEAQFQAGKGYYDGTCVVQNYSQALDWFTRAAEQGNVKAQDYTGVMYANGYGVKKDLVKAHMWLNIASSTEPNHTTNRDKIAEMLNPEQLKEAQRLATDWVARRENAKRKEEFLKNIKKDANVVEGSKNKAEHGDTNPETCPPES